MRSSWIAARVFALASMLPLLAAAPSVAEDERGGLALSIGRFDIARDEKPFEAGLEYRFRPVELWSTPFKPVVGIAGTEDDSFWVYGGLRYDWALSERWILTPCFAASIYEQGDGKDLGGPIEFRSGLELAFRLKNGARLGLLFYHLSNGPLYEDNPGSNSLVLTWAQGR